MKVLNIDIPNRQLILFCVRKSECNNQNTVFQFELFINNSQHVVQTEIFIDISVSVYTQQNEAFYIKENVSL